MRISKFIKVDVDVLLEYIYDDSNYLMEDYTVIIDTLSNTRAFSNNEKTNSQKSITKNITKNQLFEIDSKSNKWGVISEKYLFLQHKDFSGNVPFIYDTIRLHFPVNYTFKDKLGFLLNVNLLNETQTLNFPISNYFYDKTDSNRLDMDFTSPPFIFNEKLWGKYIEILIPSPYNLVNDVIINQGIRLPKTGTIHTNLTNNDVLSNETPLFINFQFLTSKSNILDKVSYITSQPFSITLPSVPEFQNLGTSIIHSTNGDYFELNGLFNNNISDFNSFMKNSILLGKSYYIIYEITTYEKNIQTGYNTIAQFDNFDVAVEFRPIIKYSTTTAIIDITMKIINAVDDSIILRKATYTMLQDEVCKYSKFLTKINTKDTYKPKIYNAKPDTYNMLVSANTNVNTVNIPYAVVYERKNISVKNINTNVNDTIYYGQGQQQLLLHPTNNIFKFVIASGSDNNGLIPYSLPTESQIFLRFKSNSTIIDSGLYYDSNEVDLKNGVIIFNILETSYEVLKKMYNDGFNQFYIILKSDTGVNSTLYFGTFVISN